MFPWGDLFLKKKLFNCMKFVSFDDWLITLNYTLVDALLWRFWAISFLRQHVSAFTKSTKLGPNFFEYKKLVVSKPLPKSRSTDTKMSYIRLTTTTTTTTTPTGGGDYVDGGDDSIRPFLPLFDLSLVRIKNITKNSSQTAEKKTFSLLRIFSVKKVQRQRLWRREGPPFPVGKWF